MLIHLLDVEQFSQHYPIQISRYIVLKQVQKISQYRVHART